MGLIHGLFWLSADVNFPVSDHNARFPRDGQSLRGQCKRLSNLPGFWLVQKEKKIAWSPIVLIRLEATNILTETQQTTKHGNARKMIPLWYLVLGVGVSVLAVTGNGIVAYLIVTRPQLHNAANWIVLSLAPVDFFVRAGSVLTQCLQRASIITHNVYYNILSFLFALSTTNLCLLALERYLFITKPLRYVDLVRTRRVVLVIVSAWVAVFIPHLLLYLICIKLPASEKSTCVEHFAIFDFAFFETLPMIILGSLHWEKSSSSPENYPAKQQDRQHNYGSTTDQRMPGKRRRKTKGPQQWRLSELRSLSSRSAIWSNSITLCFISLPLQFPRMTSTAPMAFVLS